MLIWVQIFAEEQRLAQSSKLDCETRHGGGQKPVDFGEKIPKMEGKGKGWRVPRRVALCSVLVYLSLAKAEAVTRGLEQSLCCGGRLGNPGVGAEMPSSGEKPGGNTWGSGRVGGERVGKGGFIVGLVGRGGWRALEVALWRGKRLWQALVWRKPHRIGGNRRELRE